jgi:hypothetical protein
VAELVEHSHVSHVDVNHRWIAREDMPKERPLEDSDSALAQTEPKRQRLADTIHMPANDDADQKLRNESYTVTVHTASKPTHDVAVMRSRSRVGVPVQLPHLIEHLLPQLYRRYVM